MQTYATPYIYIYPYSTIIGWGKYWQKLYLERMVGKYLVNLRLNKTIYTYIMLNKNTYGAKKGEAN